MKSTRAILVAAVAVVVAVVAATVGFAATGSSDRQSAETASASHAHLAAADSAKAANLRVTLNRLLGEHMVLAAQASQAGFSGRKDFGALAKSLDRNSVELANAIGSVYGTAARNKFLNGKLLWRDHIRFFVDYTVGLATKNRARQNRAVGNLRGYTEAFSAFLADATGLPQSALRKGITQHVMHLKGQIDAYSQGRYARSSALTRTGYKHMGMTGDALAAAIVKKFPAKFR